MISNKCVHRCLLSFTLYLLECSLPSLFLVSPHGSSIRIYLNFWYVILGESDPLELISL